MLRGSDRPSVLKDIDLELEVFYREAKGWLGLKEYQVRDKRSLQKHFILVFCAYTFMRTRILRFPQNREMSVLWHQLTGRLRRRWANQELKTFVDSLEAFRTAISFRFFNWLKLNIDVFASYKASCGFIWA